MNDLRELQIGPARKRPTPIDLRDLGFAYRVSPEARAEIEAAERRSMLVITTSHLYRFGGR